MFGTEDCCLDIVARVCYESSDGDILSQYITFAKVFDGQIRLYGNTRKAIEETIKICRDKGVLESYLKNEEVASIMYTFMDKNEAYENALRTERKEGRAEGRAEGEEKGIEKGKIIGAVEVMRDDGKDDLTIISRIANKYNLSEEQAKEYVLPPA